MATLFNTKIKDTYQSLLKLEDNTILTTTSKNITDGLGNASPLYLSTTQVRIGSNSASAMYWDNVNNRLGIGTVSPAGKLHVDGISLFYSGSAYTQIQGNMIYLNGGNGIVTENYIKSYTNGFSIGTIPANNFHLLTGNTERLTVSGTGNVLIGTTTDAGFKLDVNGSTRVKGNSLTLSASGLSSPPANYVGINFDDSGNHHQNWFAINSKADPGSGITTGYNRIIFPTMGASNPAIWNFNALGAASAIQLSAVNSTTGNYLTLSDSSISFVGTWNVVSIDRTNRKLIFGNMLTDVNHLAVYDVVIKGAKPNEGNYGGAASNGGNVYVVGGTPATSPAGNYGSVILAHDGTTARGNVGIGTITPSRNLDIVGTLRATSQIDFTGLAASGHAMVRVNDNGTLLRYATFAIDNATNNAGQQANLAVGTYFSTLARLFVVGSGSTSATTSLLVQNSSGALSFKCTDDLVQQFNGYQTSFTHPTYTGSLLIFSAGNNQQTIRGGNGENIVFGAGGNTMNLNATEVYVSSSFLGSNFWIQPNASFCLGQQATANASALLDMRSTTKGFLPPRVTTIQKNAISSPSPGLMVYDTDLARPCFFNGTSWITL